MKKMILLFSLLAAPAWGGPSQFDLRERIQFVLTEKPKIEVRFEYCRLADCKPLVDRGFSSSELQSVIGKSLLPTGLALQLVADASVNRLIKPSIEYSVGGLVPSDKGHFAICRDKEIREQLKTKTKPEDFIIKFDISNCPQVIRSVSSSVKSEADLLKLALEKITSQVR